MSGPADAAGDHPHERGRSAAQAGDEADATDPATSDEDATDATPEAEAPTADETEAAGQQARPTDTHGYAVSDLATGTELTGQEKGTAISELARSNAAATDVATDQATDETDVDDETRPAPSRSAAGAQARTDHAGDAAR